MHIVNWRRSRSVGSGVVAAIYKYTRTTEILWRKRVCMATLQVRERAFERLGHSQEESAPTLALTGFYCFSWPLTSKMVLLYYAKVCFGGYLLQTKERMLLNTSKKDIWNVKGEMVQTRLCSIPGRSSSGFRKIKILSKHLLTQGEGVLARASLIAV